MVASAAMELRGGTPWLSGLTGALLVCVPWGCGDDSTSPSDITGTTSAASTTEGSGTTSPLPDPDSTGSTTTAHDATGGGSSSTTGRTGTDSGTDAGSDTGSGTDASTGSTGSEPSCGDGQLNGDETAVDCGGMDCEPCADGEGCESGSDCESGVCAPGTSTCASPTCDDLVVNQDETDVDCGGAVCSPCPDGGGCIMDADCQSDVCDAGACVGASCIDGVLNRGETDIDCGGPTCSPCVPGDECLVPGDCDSGVCTGYVCVAASCTDAVLNQDETDVDCGGASCPGCPDGGTCLGDGDCASTSCEAGACVSCSDGVLNQDETDVDCGGSICPSCPGQCGHTIASIDWNLPAPMHGYDSDVVAPKPFESVATHSDDCGVVGETYRYDVLDISGDGLVDLVVTDDSCISDDIGRTHWRVFLGTPTGFSDMPTVWNLPAPMHGYDNDVAAPKPFESVSTHSDDCGVVGETYRYDVLDISGDGLVDLVLTDDSCVSGDIGRTHWRVFLGTATGFSDLPTTWSLPAPMHGYDNDTATPKPFESASTHSDDCGVVGETYRYDVLDISGDGIVDLVLTDDSCVSDDIGRTHWRVFLGTAAGFSGVPTTWSLPAPMHGYDDDTAAPKPFESVSTHSDDCGVVGETFRYDVLDISGDGTVDLVLTDDSCISDDIGRTHWRVFLGAPAGFSDVPTDWGLPLPMHGYDADVAAPKPFESVWTHSDDCGVVSETYRYDTFDISGDALVDLVLSDDSCVSDDIGRTHWRVFLGTPAGFSDVATTWDLPAPMHGYDADVAAPKPFESVSTHSDDCGVVGETYRYDVLDLSGDGVIDIVLTDDSCVSDDIGRTYWRTFTGAACVP